MCGDEYSIELILSSMLQQNDCYSNPDKPDTILVETIIDNAPKTISITLASYHRKMVFLYHEMWEQGGSGDKFTALIFN